MSHPETMKALVLHEYGDTFADNLRVEERPMPKPGPGQVLVRMEASPVNPSDTMFLRGLYGLKKDLPIVPGFEGAGKVVEAGPGALPRAWKGRRVACLTSDVGDGPWAEYMVTDAMRVFPVGSLSDEQAATAMVNPLTALALFEMARQRGARAAVSTAAASQVGRMLLRIGKQRAVPVIHIVRRNEQVEMLREMGGEHILNSTAPDFDDQLYALSRQLNATILFDAVAGELTGRVMKAMPHGSLGVVYGALSQKRVQISTTDLIFKDKHVTGFWLAKPNTSLSIPAMVRVLASGRSILKGDALVKSDIRGRFTLDEAPEAIAAYESRMSDGKVLITPNED